MYSLVACLGDLTVNHASLSRRSTIPTFNGDTSNSSWALIALFPDITQKRFEGGGKSAHKKSDWKHVRYVHSWRAKNIRHMYIRAYGVSFVACAVFRRKKKWYRYVRTKKLRHHSRETREIVFSTPAGKKKKTLRARRALPGAHGSQPGPQPKSPGRASRVDFLGVLSKIARTKRHVRKSTTISLTCNIHTRLRAYFTHR